MALGTLPNKEKRASSAEGKESEKIDNLEDVALLLKAQRKVKLIIPSTETERDPVDVQINGYAYRIKRDEQVEVPEAVIDALRNAKVIQYVQKPREDGEGNELVPVITQRFAFQVG